MGPCKSRAFSVPGTCPVKAWPWATDLINFIVWSSRARCSKFGVAPSVVLSLVKLLWERRLQKIFRDAEDAVMRHEDAGPDDVILHIGGVHLMVDGWSDAVPNVNSCPLSELPDNMAMWMSIAPDDPSGLPPRALVTNLSMRLRAFHTALGSSYMGELRAERTGRTASKQRRR